MSHFAILVVTDDEPTDELLTAAMQPFHEYECTGKVDQYVVPVDVTDEVLEEYARPQKVVEMPDGQLLSRYDDCLYKEVPDDSKFAISKTKKKFQLPDGAVEREAPAQEAREAGIGYLTEIACADEYCGAHPGDPKKDPRESEGRYYKLTNPNKKWDWWVVGGRWTGVYMPSYRPDEDPRNKETCWLCSGSGRRSVEGLVNEDPAGFRPEAEYDPVRKTMKCNGCQGTGQAVKFSSQWVRAETDRCRVAQLRIGALRDAAESQALGRWDRYSAIAAGRPFQTWDEARGKGVDGSVKGRSTEDWDAVRKSFWEQDVVKEIAKADDYSRFHASDILESLRRTREEEAALARLQAPVLFGYLKDGQWHERGQMGWFATVSNEEDKESWARRFNEMLESLRPDQWVTVVDCHI